jgi:hypothetical protein
MTNVKLNNFYLLRLHITEMILQPDFLGRNTAPTFRRNYCLQSFAQKSHMTYDKGPEQQKAASGSPAGAGGLKNLWLGVGLKGVICTVDRQ